MQSGLLVAAYASLFLFLLRWLPFVRRSGIRPATMSTIFLLKVIAGTALWAIYTFYYDDRSTADIFKYFDDSSVMFNALVADPKAYAQMLFGIGNDSAYLSENYYQVMNHWYREYETTFYNDSHTIIRFNALVRLFSFGEFHVHTLFMSFLSTLGCVALFRSFQEYLVVGKTGLVLACFLLPSMLLWTSAPMKEGLLITGLGLFLFQFMHLVNGRISLLGLVVMMLSMALVFFQKFYVLASMLPGLLIYAWGAKFLKPSLTVKSLSVVLLCAVTVLAIGQLIPSVNLLELLTRKQHDFINHGLATGSQSMIPVPELDGTVRSFVLSAPQALFNSIVGPSYYLRGGSFGVAANLENLVILGSLLLAVIYHKRSHGRLAYLAIYCVLFILVLFLIIGWTTPVLGALVRYRTPALPFVLILSLTLVDDERLIERFPFTKFLFR